MAISKIIKSLTKAIAIAGVAAFAASPASAEPIYHLTLCGGPAPTPGSPCYVTSTTIAPPPGSTDGLTDEAIRNFLIDSGNTGFLGDITHTITGANSSGYVWGNFVAVASADPLFIFRDGAVICCTSDQFWTDVNINNNGTAIGKANGPFILPIAALDSTPLWSPDLDPGSETLLTGLSPEFPNRFWSSASFLEIDDAGRVSGINDLGAFLLAPVTDAVDLPEPASSVIVLGGLMLLLALRSRQI